MTEAEFDAYVRACCKRLGTKNGALSRKCGIKKHERWHFDYSTGILEFGPARGEPVHRVRAFGLGTYSSKGFKWTWASSEVPADAQAPSARLKPLAQARGVPPFAQPTFKVDSVAIQWLIAIAVEELGLLGCYLADGPKFGTAIGIEALLPPAHAAPQPAR